MYASSMTVGNQQEPYQQTMGCMFAPTNEALEEFFSPTGEGADFTKLSVLGIMFQLRWWQTLSILI